MVFVLVGHATDAEEEVGLTFEADVDDGLEGGGVVVAA